MVYGRECITLVARSAPGPELDRDALWKSFSAPGSLTGAPLDAIIGLIACCVGRRHARTHIPQPMLSTASLLLCCSSPLPGASLCPQRARREAKGSPVATFLWRRSAWRSERCKRRAQNAARRLLLRGISCSHCCSRRTPRGAFHDKPLALETKDWGGGGFRALLLLLFFIASARRKM